MNLKIVIAKNLVSGDFILRNVSPISYEMNKIVSVESEHGEMYIWFEGFTGYVAISEDAICVKVEV